MPAMLVDEVMVSLKAGAGGRGAAAFNKVRLSRGPTGGDGGRGGSIYVEGVSDINALSWYAWKKELVAQPGQNGRGQFIDGHRGDDLVLKVPTGTKITNRETGYTREIADVGERILLLGGGAGGRGNFKFRSSTNTSPKEFEEGSAGDIGTFTFELRLIADVGLVGLPNAGKSSLLNELTAAKSKVANYPFTTLEPHLGAYYGLLIADVPGLIEGASSGKGLGVKFLKHVGRTKTLFHLVSAESDDPVRDYNIVRAELEAYDRLLAQKEERILLTKADTLSPEQLKKIQAAFAAIGKHAEPLSLFEPATLGRVRNILNAMQNNRH